MIYEIYMCDVWGNDEDGYHVNDVSPTGKTITDKNLLRWLATLLPTEQESVKMHGDTKDVIYIDLNDKPYCELRRVVCER